MNIHTAYTIYNNGIQSVEPQLADKVIGDIPVFWDVSGGYWCESCGFKEMIDDLRSKLDRTELAEVKARIEIEAIDGYYSALLKKRVLQVEAMQAENKQLRTGIDDLREYIGYQPHSDLAENVVDILYKILNDEAKVGESNAI